LQYSKIKTLSNEKKGPEKRMLKSLNSEAPKPLQRLLKAV
jgi:hypothetical protein